MFFTVDDTEQPPAPMVSVSFFALRPGRHPACSTFGRVGFPSPAVTQRALSHRSRKACLLPYYPGGEECYCTLPRRRHVPQCAPASLDSSLE